MKNQIALSFLILLTTLTNGADLPSKGTAVIAKTHKSQGRQIQFKNSTIDAVTLVDYNGLMNTTLTGGTTHLQLAMPMYYETEYYNTVGLANLTIALIFTSTMDFMWGRQRLAGTITSSRGTALDGESFPSIYLMTGYNLNTGGNALIERVDEKKHHSIFYLPVGGIMFHNVKQSNGYAFGYVTSAERTPETAEYLHIGKDANKDEKKYSNFQPWVMCCLATENKNDDLVESTMSITFINPYVSYTSTTKKANGVDNACAPTIEIKPI